jgi:FAD/FMN-containing dehydrogenase
VSQYELMAGPKPSTHPSCTIGGMIGNNSCGSTAQAYGKMADSVNRLEILTYDGTSPAARSSRPGVPAVKPCTLPSSCTGRGLGGSLPPVPAAPFANTDRETDEPCDQQDRSDPPEGVQGKTQPAKDDRQDQDQKDQEHDCPFRCRLPNYFCYPAGIAET